MKTTTTIPKLILGFFFISSLTLMSQKIIWSEDFSAREQNSTSNIALPEQDGFAESFIGNNGVWIIERNPSSNGTKSNRWQISESEQFSGIDKCSITAEDIVSSTTSSQSGGNSLFIGESLTRVYKSDSPAIPGAFYSNGSNTNTDTKFKSPIINLFGMKDINIKFDYMLGALDLNTQFIVSYYDGSIWRNLPAVSNTFSEFCPAPRTSKWLSSPVFYLPSDLNNNSNFQIAFTFISNPDGQGTSSNVSVAIDNIVISGNYVDPNNSVLKTANNTSVIDIKTIADKKNNPIFVFTTHSEKFPANDLIIESSTDGTEFNELSKIQSNAVKGSVTKLEYNFTDNKANDGVNYYRITQVNADKTTVVSDIVSVDHIKAKNVTFTVYPNPNSGQFTVDFSGIENNHEVQIVLNDMNDGHEIYSTTFHSNSIEANKMDVNPPTKIAPGRYLCSLIFEGNRSSVIILIH